MALLRLMRLAAAAATAARATGGSGGGGGACTVAGATWSYLAPQAFEGVEWNNNGGCLYSFEASADAGTFEFTSPSGCMGTDPWGEPGGGARGVLLGGGRVVQLNFTIPGKAIDVPPTCSTSGGPTCYAGAPSAASACHCNRCMTGGHNADEVCGCPGASPASCKPCNLCTGCVANTTHAARIIPQRVERHTGWLTPDCAFIDMDDGGLYVRGVHPMDMAPHDWLKFATAWVMRAAMMTFEDGTRHITPGVPKSVPHPKPNDGYYVGQWMRDSFYGISNGWSLVNETEQRGFAESAAWMFSHPRADGLLGEVCVPSGGCIYAQTCADHPPAPGWEQCLTLDTSSFAVKLAAHIWERMTPSEGAAFYKKWLPTLLLSLNVTTKDPDGSGLLWSNTSRPQLGYGFQDGETKSGDVLYSSLLYWNATRLIARMADKQGDHALAGAMSAQADLIKGSANRKLWNSSLGVFMASTGMESSNVDVWGNAFAAAMGFTTAEQSSSIFAFFRANLDGIFLEGQVREIPKPHQWTDAEAGASSPRSTQRMYQNGGYWGTPLHHVLPFLAMHDRDLACGILNQTIASYRTHGIWEWIGPFYPSKVQGAPGYTASATDAFFASEQLRCWSE